MKVPKLFLALLAIGIPVAAAAVARVNQQPGAKMTEAATKLLEGLPEELKDQASFGFDDPERINWHFIPRDRKGAVLKAMTPDQRELAKGLLRAGTSESGYQTALNVMMLEAILRDIENTERARQIRNPLLYYVSIFGKPSNEGTWGWKFEGHHLCVNYTVKGGVVIAETPLFYGANPGKVPSGPHEGLRTLPREEDLARKLYTSLQGDKRKKATIAEKAPPEIQSGTQNTEPKSLPLDGIAYSDLGDEQKKLIDQILHVYVDKHPPEISSKLLGQVNDAGKDQIHFGWAGPDGVGQPHYYRIQGPTFIIEYNNTQNNANHIHSVWRNKSGEFGTQLAKR